MQSKDLVINLGNDLIYLVKVIPLNRESFHKSDNNTCSDVLKRASEFFNKEKPDER